MILATRLTEYQTTMYNKRKVTEDNSGGKNKTILLLSFARKGEDGMVCPMLGKVSSRVSEDKQKGFFSKKEQFTCSFCV